MKVLALITAKSTSSRVAYKNKMPLYGKPLYRWTTDFVAQHGEFFTDCAFSTDKPRDYRLYEGMIPLFRPEYYLRDSTPHIESVSHAHAEIEKFTGRRYDMTMLFQPTNPLRTTKMLYHAMGLAEFFLGKTDKPYFSRCVYEDKNLSKGYFHGCTWNETEVDRSPIVKSGAVYCYSREYLVNPKGGCTERRMFVPKQVGYNINDALDMRIVEAFMKEQGVPYGYTGERVTEQG